jgi:flagellar biosynthesis/type III secretory pathway M-ring protein FliF/YscJ
VKARLRRWEPRITTGVIVSVIVLTVAAGIFGIEYARASATCAAQIAPGPCMSESSLQMWTNGVFASLAGLMLAILMAMTVGVRVRREPAPDTALARRLAAEDMAWKAAEERRAQLRELNAIALSHVVTNQAKKEVAKEEEERARREAGIPTPEEEAAMARWEEEQREAETEAQRQGKLLMERMITLARRDPKVVADIIEGWINQPPRRR